jgi:hypothetical protein
MRSIYLDGCLDSDRMLARHAIVLLESLTSGAYGK